jgi:hypothetical protein
MPTDLLRELAEAIGVNFLALAVLFGVGGLIGAPFIRAWIEGRVRGNVEQQLLARRAELEKDLERHKADLALTAESARAELAKRSTDYALWAQRRHEATAALFAEMLKAEDTATSLYEFAVPRMEDTSEAQLVALLEASKATPEESEPVLTAFRFPDLDGAKRKLEPLLERARTNKVIRARNRAYAAYFGHALYLAPEVDEAARAVRDHFHEWIVEFQAPLNGRPQFVPLKTKLRFLMLELLNAARADLGRSTV